MVAKNGIAFALAFAWIVSIGSAAFSGDVQARVTVNASSILIGDQVQLHVEVESPADVSVQWPALPDALKAFEIVNPGKIETAKTEKGNITSTNIVLTSFDAGTHVVPGLRFLYKSKTAGEDQVVTTKPLSVEVKNVAVDTAKDIKDVKPPQDIPLTWRDVLPYALAGAGILALLYLSYYVIKKRRKGEKLLPVAPPRPAHETALDALAALETRRLWQNGQVKEYHSELADIIRNYIEQKFAIPAMEMITEDILDSRKWPTNLNEDLRSVLVTADFVKFAKLLPAPQDNERSFSLAKAFVESTHRASPVAGDVAVQNRGNSGLQASGEEVSPK